MFTIKEQVALIIYFLVFGVFSITVYTIFSFFLNKFKVKKIISYPLELGFWIFLTYLAVKYLLKTTHGYLPLYGVCFYIIGIIIYLYLLDKMFKEDLERVYQFFKIFFQKSKKLWTDVLLPLEVFKIFKKNKKKGECSHEESNNVIDVDSR